MHLHPYEPKNLIFIDTEFSSLDPATGEILSVGIVKLTGESLYLELEFEGQVDAWVAQNIMPTLTGVKVSHVEAKKQIKQFIGSKKPFAVAYVDNYDNLYFIKLFGVGKLPFNWLTIDFSSILFANGINPGKSLATGSDVKKLYEGLGIDLGAYLAHYALDDARLLRNAWLAISKNK